MSTELEEVRAHMKKTQLKADEVQGTFETHNGDYLRMKVIICQHISFEKEAADNHCTALYT